MIMATASMLRQMRLIAVPIRRLCALVGILTHGTSEDLHRLASSVPTTVITLLLLEGLLFMDTCWVKKGF
jgi:hypothetical protein